MNYTRLVWRLRNHAFDDRPESKELQFDRVLTRAVAKKIEQRKREEPPPTRRPFSGMTKAGLAQSGTCETDWY